MERQGAEMGCHARYRDARQLFVHFPNPIGIGKMHKQGRLSSSSSVKPVYHEYPTVKDMFLTVTVRNSFRRRQSP